MKGKSSGGSGGGGGGGAMSCITGNMYVVYLFLNFVYLVSD